jgi:hypothetical protein
MDHHNINTAIAHVWTDENNGITNQTLVAYVVLDDPNMFSENSLKEYLAKQLNSYMIPSIFSVLESNEVPRLPSGKVNRKMLVRPEIKVIKVEKLTKVCFNEIQQMIYNVFVLFFGSQEINLHDDFFKDLGGHSLIASQTISMLRKDKLFCNIGVKDLYQNVIDILLLAFYSIAIEINRNQSCQSQCK